jgi:hypothetical protein
MYLRLRNWVFWVFFLSLVLPSLGFTADSTHPETEELTVLDRADSSHTSFPSNSSMIPHYKWAVGASYTGGQVRYQFSPRWALEMRYQFGSADSDYGTVRANVWGLRGYHFYPVGLRERFSWYWGGEGAYAKTNSLGTSGGESNLRVSGFAVGAFGGIEYRVLPRIAVSTDIGPYLISLKESDSGISSTGLDFVVNTAINFYIF